MRPRRDAALPAHTAAGRTAGGHAKMRAAPAKAAEDPASVETHAEPRNNKFRNLDAPGTSGPPHGDCGLGYAAEKAPPTTETNSNLVERNLKAIKQSPNVAEAKSNASGPNIKMVERNAEFGRTQVGGTDATSIEPISSLAGTARTWPNPSHLAEPNPKIRSRQQAALSKWKGS